MKGPVPEHEQGSGTRMGLRQWPSQWPPPADLGQLCPLSCVCLSPAARAVGWGLYTVDPVRPVRLLLETTASSEKAMLTMEKSSSSFGSKAERGRKRTFPGCRILETCNLQLLPALNLAVGGGGHFKGGREVEAPGHGEGEHWGHAQEGWEEARQAGQITPLGLALQDQPGVLARGGRSGRGLRAVPRAGWVLPPGCAKLPALDTTKLNR